MVRPIAFLLAVSMLGAWAQPASGPQARRDLSKVDVCQLVAGEAIALAVGGKLAAARPFRPADARFARCTYLVVPAGAASDASRGYTLWLYPPADFESLKSFTEAKMTAVPALGDGAYLFLDPGDKRFKLRVLRRGDVTIEATADTAEAARKVAEVAVNALAKSR